MIEEERQKWHALLQEAEMGGPGILLSVEELRDLLCDSEQAGRIRDDVEEIKAHLVRERDEARAALARCRNLLEVVPDYVRGYEACKQDAVKAVEEMHDVPLVVEHGTMGMTWIREHTIATIIRALDVSEGVK